MGLNTSTSPDRIATRALYPGKTNHCIISVSYFFVDLSYFWRFIVVVSLAVTIADGCCNYHWYWKSFYVFLKSWGIVSDDVILFLVYVMIFRNLFSTNVSFNKIDPDGLQRRFFNNYPDVVFSTAILQYRSDFPVTSQLFQQTPTNDEGLNKILGVPKYLQQKNSELRNSTLNSLSLEESEELESESLSLALSEGLRIVVDPTLPSSLLISATISSTSEKWLSSCSTMVSWSSTVSSSSWSAKPALSVSRKSIISSWSCKELLSWGIYDVSRNCSFFSCFLVLFQSTMLLEVRSLSKYDLS